MRGPRDQGFGAAVVALCVSCGQAAVEPSGEASIGGRDAAADDSFDAAAVVADARTSNDAGANADSRPAGTKRDGRPGVLAPDAFFGSSRCDKDALFCDDFEGGVMNSTLWDFTYESATGKVETPPAAIGAARGRYAF